jgi:hypothetical protein
MWVGNPRVVLEDFASWGTGTFLRPGNQAGAGRTKFHSDHLIHLTRIRIMMLTVVDQARVEIFAEDLDSAVKIGSHACPGR